MTERNQQDSLITPRDTIQHKNGQIMVLCPFCSYRFPGDPNSTFATCDMCGGRVFYDEVYF